MRQHYVGPDGRRGEPGQLVRLSDGRAAETRPVRCPNGHVLAHGTFTPVWLPCRVEGRNGHRTHRCHACDGVVYTPPLDEHCWRDDGQHPQT
ncbi:hypothetical protein [Nocardia sp. CY41]|uniref:hypothetical protein n=1 Tax=Nocardia sp. CY41 TaxID=2608686 RepID=UPI00135BC8B1|nr:hypothetical protein [Nocardia sp. CY41]